MTHLNNNLHNHHNNTDRSLIYQWVNSILANLSKDLSSCFEESFSIEQISGDASVRQYYLLNFKHQVKRQYQNFIIMHAPSDNSLRNFIKIADFLANLKLPFTVPKIFAVQEYSANSYVLLSYLGSELLFKNINLQNAEAIYALAWKTIADLQAYATRIHLVKMDKNYIRNQLNIFNHWYLQKHLQLTNPTVTSKINNLLENLENYFEKIFNQQPQAFVHIDYQSKNLILNKTTNQTDSPSLGILDFQDAMFGPITYDLVSLLQDAYLVWPEQLVEKILFDYYDYIKSNGYFNLQQLPKQTFLKHFYLTGLQRHLKNLGVFARLKYFYNKPNYIQYIPNLLYYINNTCNKFPDLNLDKLQQILTMSSGA